MVTGSQRWECEVLNVVGGPKQGTVQAEELLLCCLWMVQLQADTSENELQRRYVQFLVGLKLMPCSMT